jgi:hypothetical protein
LSGFCCGNVKERNNRAQAIARIAAFFISASLSLVGLVEKGSPGIVNHEGRGCQRTALHSRGIVRACLD